MKPFLVVAILPLCLSLLGCSPRSEAPAPGALGSKSVAVVADVVEFPQAQFSAGDDLDFADYPAAVYTGPVVTPDFKGTQKAYANYRTHILAAAAEGPDFAGSLTIVAFGCGTGCVTEFMYDVKTGAFHDLPAAGEDYPEAFNDYRADSRLLMTQWRGGDWDHPTCVRAFHEWTGDGFKELQKREASGVCPDMWGPPDSSAGGASS